MCLKLRRECKDDYIKVGENKVYWLLEGGVGKGGQVLEEGAFQRCVDQQAQKRWTGLASGKDKPFSKDVITMPGA